MKKTLLYLPLFVSCLLIAGCKKDNQVPVQKITGTWTDEKPGLFRTGREWTDYTFREPNYCRIDVERADADDIIIDSLTFTVVDNTLQIYHKGGLPYGHPAHIEKITNSRLELKYPSGHTETWYR
jgi:hypothetical protein